MCGRVLLDTSIVDIISLYNICVAENQEIRSGEKHPGTMLPVVTNDVGNQIRESKYTLENLKPYNNRKLSLYKWGYKITADKEIINCRLETAPDKTSFSESFYTRRCIIPVNGFFEWKTFGDVKTKYVITSNEDKIMSIAGIYSSFQDKNKQPFTGFAVLTRPADGEMSRIHHRMPVIINKEYEEHWLSLKTANVRGLQKQLLQCKEDRLSIRPAEAAVQMSFEDIL